MSSSNTVRGSDAHNFSVVPSAELPARVAQDCQLNKADAKDLSAQSSTLTDAEALELSSLEATVERSLKAFWEIGQALRQIRDRRLYRQDFSTFEDYCTNRWEMSRRWAYQLIEAATVYEPTFRTLNWHTRSWGAPSESLVRDNNQKYPRPVGSQSHRPVGAS